MVPDLRKTCTTNRRVTLAGECAYLSEHDLFITVLALGHQLTLPVTRLFYTCRYMDVNPETGNEDMYDDATNEGGG
jgi:hypothetical protein